MPQQVVDNIGKLMPKPVPQSPQAASLGTFGTYQVNLYNGLPQISIPIYEAKSGNLRVPITLSYHASGVKMYDPGGWVGYGWTISAGGQVSRQTRGDADEQHYYSSPLIEFPYVCGPNGNWTYLDYAWKGIYDTEPDIFNYSFNGRSGNFTLGHRNAEPPFLFPYAPLAITHSGMFTSLESFPLQKFEIKDEHGVLYRFGQNSQGQNFGEGTTTDRSPFPSISVQTAWNLAEIISPHNDDRIDFTYQNVGNAWIHEPRENITVLDNCMGAAPGRPCPAEGVQTPMVGSNTSNINQNGLDEILFEDGKVEFVLGGLRSDNSIFGIATLKSLDEIIIYKKENGAYQIQGRVKFIYSYFGYSTSPATPVRLRLDELRFLDAFGALLNKYKFEYHTNTFSWNQHAGQTPYPWYSKDYWGNYNGYINTSLIPTQNITYNINSINHNATIGAANRNSNPQYMKEGVLKKITFPTGGYTEFDYESHRYQEDNQIKYAGGLRVTTIKSYDNVGAGPITKTYKYGENETGFGIKNFFNSLLYYNTESNHLLNICLSPPGSGGGTPGTTSYRQRTYYSNSTIEIDSRDGSPVVYPVVTEYVGDEQSNLGKTVFEYDNKLYEPDSMNIIIGPQTSKNYKADKSWKRGKLTKTIVYNTGGSKLSESISQFTIHNRQKIQIGTAINQFRIYAPGPDFHEICPNSTYWCLDEFGNNIDFMMYQHARYLQPSGILLETSKQDTYYPNGDPAKAVVTNQSITYDPVHLQVLSTTQSNSSVNTEQIITTNSYPFSYNLTGNLSGAAKATKKLKDDHVFAVPIENYVRKQNSDGSNSRVISGQVMIYRENEANINHIVPDKVFMLEASSGITNYSPTTFSTSNATLDSRYTERLKFNSYDALSNLNDVSKTSPTGVLDLGAAYQWGYDNTKPVAEVTNAQNTWYQANLASTGSAGFTISSSSSITVPITVDYSGTVTLKIGLPGTPSLTVYADYKLDNGSLLTLTLTNAGGCGFNTATFSNVPVGAHSVIISLRNSSGPTIGACGQVEYPDHVLTSFGMKEFFYENFEEGSATGTATPHTGKKYLVGDYTSTFVKPNARTYIIEYWYLNGSTWTYATAIYSNGMILTNGSAIDNVRIYPTDARMKSYTYDLALGITSVIDENGAVQFYEYDSFGRLAQIKDDKGHIVQQYMYNYKTN